MKIRKTHIFLIFLMVILLAFWRQNGERSLAIAKSWFDTDTLTDNQRQSMLDSIERIDSADLAAAGSPIAPPPVFEQLDDRWKIEIVENLARPTVIVQRQPKADTAHWTVVHRLGGGGNGVSVEDFDGDKLVDLVINNKRGGNELWLFDKMRRDFRKVGTFGQLSTLKFHVFYETLYADSLTHVRGREKQLFYSRLMRISGFDVQTIGELEAPADTTGAVEEVRIWHQRQLVQTVDGTVLKGYYKNEAFDTDDFLKIFWHNNFQNFLKN